MFRIGLIFILGIAACSQLPTVSQQQTSFVAFGDSGFGNENQRKLAKGIASFCRKDTCDFVALLGDNFYPSGVESVSDPKWQSHFEVPFSEVELPFYAVLGNHDYGGNIQSQLDYSKKSKKWKMPERYYAFTKGPVDFFAIDTQNFDNRQRNWLESKLKASSSLWKVVYGHHPVFSHGTHGDSPELKEKLLPLLKNRVDFYISGHDHDLQYLLDEGRPQFIVSGATGQPRESKRGEKSIFSSHDVGFAYFHFTPTEGKVSFLKASGEKLFEKSVLKN